MWWGPRWNHPGPRPDSRPPVYDTDDRGRLWWVYMIPCYDPDDMHLPEPDRRIVVGYIGETSRQDAGIRFCEHLDEKPWSDTVVDPDRCGEPLIVDQFDETLLRFQVLSVRFRTAEAARGVEQDQVEWLLPLYNHEYNLTNQDRIPVYDQPVQRAGRDAAAGLPEHEKWAYQQALRVQAGDEFDGYDDEPAGRSGWSWRWPDFRPARMTRRRRRRLAWAVAWVAVTAGLWWAGVRYTTIEPALRVGGVAATVSTFGLLRLRWRRSFFSPAGQVLLAGVVAWLLLFEHPFG